LRTLLLDPDGVVYRGETAIPGAAKTLDRVRRRDIPHLFLTNTTSRPRSAIAGKLGPMGIRIGEDEILTPPVAALPQWWRRNAGAE